MSLLVSVFDDQVQARYTGFHPLISLLTRAQVPERQRQGDVRRHLLSADARRALVAAEGLRARLQLLSSLICGWMTRC